MFIDRQCSNSGKLLPSAVQAHPPTGITCPACGRGIQTQQMQHGWAYQIHRDMADTEMRRPTSGA
jgi:hypothetical protein